MKKMRVCSWMFGVAIFATVGCAKETGAPTEVEATGRPRHTPSVREQSEASDAEGEQEDGDPCNGGTLVRKGSSFVCDCSAAPQAGPFCDGRSADHEDDADQDALALSITADSYYSCALTESDGVRCWGENEFGTLGNGTFTDSARPVAVKDLAGVRQIDAGLRCVCAVVEDGSLRCWGANDRDELRDGSNNHRNAPVTAQIEGEVVQVSLGESQNCVRRADDSLECWAGYGDWVPYPAVKDVVDVEAGYFITTAWLADGSVRHWGNQAVPPIPDGAKITRVASGYAFLCVLTDGGEVYCAGENSEGQLGSGDSASEGDGSVADISNAVDIAAGFEHACALLDDGTVHCWGQNNRGQLGDGSFDDRHAPSTVLELQHVVEVACGREHCCARKEAGQLYCWGQNAHGQLGDGSMNDSSKPVAVLGF